MEAIENETVLNIFAKIYIPNIVLILKPYAFFK